MKEIESFSENSFKIRSFGNLVSNFRKTLDLTQEDFGKLIMISRITIIKLEIIEDVVELSDDLLFRLNHLSARLMTNENFDDLVRFSAKKVYDSTNDTLAKRISNTINGPVLELIKKSYN